MEAEVQGEHAVITGLIACHECDTLHYMRNLPEHASAHCSCCNARLYRQIPSALERSMALHITALILLVVANTFPFLSLKLAGRMETDMLISGPLALMQLGMGDIGLLVLATSIVFPLLVVLTALYLLLPLFFGARAVATGTVFRLLRKLMPWSLIGIFMLAVLIAVVKLLDLAEIESGVALFAYAALLPVMILAQQNFDAALFWPPNDSPEKISFDSMVGRRAQSNGWGRCHTCAALVGDEKVICPRCGDHLHARKPNSLNRTWALLMASAILFIPANVLPIMTVIRFGQGDPSTILGGVEHLITAGMWPLGLIVFFASIMVPISKLVALVYLLLSVQRKSTWRPDERTRLYRMTEIIGSWSMIDIFVIGILTSLVSLDALATIRPGIAASFFGGVVVLTMLAAQSFDPRLIWDAVDSAKEDVEVKAGGTTTMGQGYV